MYVWRYEGHMDEILASDFGCVSLGIHLTQPLLCNYRVPVER